jgi:GxxExxY protein
MAEIIFKEECYKIMGCCFEVFNQFGYGLREKNYQKALEEVLYKQKIPFESQLYVPLKIDEKVIGKYYLDLLINDKIAVELKVGDHFLKRDIDQLYSYLKSKDLRLGILINFTSSGVKYKRILNLLPEYKSHES